MTTKTVLLSSLVGCLLPVGALAASCGHDIHGAARVEESKLGPTVTITHYISPATVVMDDPKDPMHRAFR